MTSNKLRGYVNLLHNINWTPYVNIYTFQINLNWIYLRIKQLLRNIFKKKIHLISSNFSVDCRVPYKSFFLGRFCIYLNQSTCDSQMIKKFNDTCFCRATICRNSRCIEKLKCLFSYSFIDFKVAPEILAWFKSITYRSKVNS